MHEIVSLPAATGSGTPGHKDERAYHDEQIATLQSQYARLQMKIDAAYEDKLEGSISEDFWQRKSREWRAAQTGVLASIEKHQSANQVYFDEGDRILDLASRAYDLRRQQPPEEKRKLLNLLLSNCTFDGEKLRYEYAKPFCWLLGLAEGSGCSDWLPEPEKIRTFRPPLNLPLFVASTSSDSGLSGRLRHAFSAKEVLPKLGPDPTPRETPAQRAQRFQAMLDTGEAANRADIARIEGCSRAWVTKVLGAEPPRPR